MIGYLLFLPYLIAYRVRQLAAWIKSKVKP